MATFDPRRRLTVVGDTRHFLLAVINYLRASAAFYDGRHHVPLAQHSPTRSRLLRAFT